MGRSDGACLRRALGRGIGTGVVGGGVEQHGSAHRGRATRGSRLRARLGTARRKRRGWWLGRASKRAAQVVLGIGVTAGEAGAAELQHGSDLVSRDTTAEQALSDPQIGDAPIRGRETLRNLQAMQPAGVDAGGTGRRQRAVGGKGSARRRRPPDRRRSPPDFRLGVMAQSRVGSQLRLRIHQPDPRSRTTRLAACGFLVGEPRQSSAMAPIGTGPVGAVKGGQVCGNGGSHGRLQRSQAEALTQACRWWGLVRSTTEGSCPWARMVSMVWSSAPSRSRRM